MLDMQHTTEKATEFALTYAGFIKAKQKYYSIAPNKSERTRAAENLLLFINEVRHNIPKDVRDNLPELSNLGSLEKSCYSYVNANRSISA